MLATTPNANMSCRVAARHDSPATLVNDAASLGKSSQGSAASTRASSPVSSSCSSENNNSFSSNSVHALPSKGDGIGVLAQRRGQNVLMLNELVLDLEVLPNQSPSADSTSSWGVLSGSTSRCTPCTPQLTSFTPSAAADSMVNQSERSTLRSKLMKIPGDASQRTPPSTNRMGASVAGGDASQRTPPGKVSLGVAVIGGDASQRSPPGRSSLVGVSAGGACPPRFVQQRAFEKSTVDHSKTPNLLNTKAVTASSDPQSIVSTCPAPTGILASPAASCSSKSHDASARTPTRDPSTNSTNDASNEMLKFWLSGASVCGSLVSDNDLAKQLRAAAPECYED